MGHEHYLSVLLQVVVQNLRVGLLMRCQDVHEGGRGVASGSRGVDGSPAPQSRGQTERSCWRASVETLLLKRLQEDVRQRRDTSEANCIRSLSVTVILMQFQHTHERNVRSCEEGLEIFI